MIKTIQVTNTIEISCIPLVDDFFLVRSRWKGGRDFSHAIVHSEHIELVDDIKNPDELQVLEFTSMKSEKFPNPEYSRVFIYYGDISRMAIYSGYHDDEEVFETTHLEFDESPKPGYKMCIFDSYNGACYDYNGNVLNTKYTTSICEYSFNTEKLFEDREGFADFLKILPEYKHQKCETYYDATYHVRGNGETMNIELNMTPQEYEEYFLGGKSCGVEDFIRYKIGADKAKEYIKD